MSSHRIPRRSLLKNALLGIAAAPAVGWLGRAESAPVELDVNDPQAKALGYVKDAKTVDAKANPNYKPAPLQHLSRQARPGQGLVQGLGQAALTETRFTADGAACPVAPSAFLLPAPLESP